MYMMMKRKTAAAARALSTLAAFVVLGGCAMKGDVRDLQDEIRSLALRQDSLLTELRAQTLSTQDTLRTQGNQMVDFRGDINQSIREVSQRLTRLDFSDLFEEGISYKLIEGSFSLDAGNAYTNNLTMDGDTAQVEVVGVPDPRFGEEIAACIRLGEGETATAEEIREFCKGKLAHFKIPRYVHFVEEFPMTVTGKVQKFILREQLAKELEQAS